MLWNENAAPGEAGQCSITTDGPGYYGDLGPDGADTFVDCWIKEEGGSTTTVTGGAGAGLTECEKSRDMRMTFTSICTIDEEDDVTNPEAWSKCSARTACVANADCPLDHECGKYELDPGTVTNECVL